MKLSCGSKIILAAFGFCLVGLTCLSRADATGGFQGLGDLPGGSFYSVPYGVSGDGSTMVGASTSSDWPPQAFRWTQEGGMVGLGYLPGGYFDSRAFGVSADGSVVVGYSDSASGYQAFRWTEQGGMVGLGYLPGGSHSTAYAVSADGSVVVGSGDSSVCGGQPYLCTEAFRWENGTMIGLGDLPGGDFGSWAWDVSADGSVVVGSSIYFNEPYAPPYNYPRDQAFRWENGTMIGLGFLPFGPGGSHLHQQSVASAVSADGSVVVGVSGSGMINCAVCPAFRWENGTMTYIDDHVFIPVGVSADGSVIVGDGIIGWYSRLIIWDAHHGVRNLKDMLVNDYRMDLQGFTQLRLVAGYPGYGGMSDDGFTIVGLGQNANGNTEAWIAKLDMGMITAVRGNVTLNAFKAKMLDRIRRLSTVETGADGYVNIRHPSGSEIDLAPDSKMQVDGSPAKTNLELFYGKLREKVKNLPHGALEIRTPQAGVCPFGTEFVVETTMDESVTIVLEGEVDVSTPNGSQTILLGQNQGVIATAAGLGAPFPVDPDQIDRWWEWEVEGDFYADFDLEYICETALRATNFDASNQTVTPSWRLELDNPVGPSGPNCLIDSLTFQAPYELFNLNPEPDIVEGHNYVWTGITITPGDEFEVDAEQNTYSESIYFPYTISREFSGNLISGEGDLTTTVTVIPEAGISSFDVEIFIYAAESEQAWHDGNFFGTLSSVSHSVTGGKPDDFEHEDTPISQEYEWGFWDGYVPGEPLTFTVTVHVDLDAGVDWALIEPGVAVAGRMDADFGSENWVDNTLQLPNEGGTITIGSAGQVSGSDSHIPWIGVYMPQYVASSKFDNTPEGDDIVVTPIDATTGTMPVTVIFDEVTEPGVTSLTSGSSGPPSASGFMLGDPPTYYELSTTAALPEGSQITVCIDYTGISFVDESKLKLYHYEDTDDDGIADDWVDKTISLDTKNDIICASVTSLSPFSILEPETPSNIKSIKTNVTARLEGAKIGDKKIDKELDKIIKHIQKSLEDNLWIDVSHLNSKHGKKVFDEEKKAAKKLMQLMDNEDIPEAVKDACRVAIDKLIEADDILAITVYNEALDAAGDPKVDKELEKCNKAFEKADEELAKENYDKAIDHYKKAWEHAQKAIKYASE